MSKQDRMNARNIKKKSPKYLNSLRKINNDPPKININNDLTGNFNTCSVRGIGTITK